MKLRPLLYLFLLAGAWTSAQTTTATIDEIPDLRTPEELEDLLAPIALHPDALIALILPASTEPSDVVLAARRLARNSDPASLDDEPWDDSVRALARYPEIIKWMDENLEWTTEVGEAFVDQPADVMNAIQRLRQKARAAGTLTDTPQQQVVVEEDIIRIVPARTEVIYVPRYDPQVVYVSRPVYYPTSFISFGIGYTVGHWLAYDCDWPRRTIWVVPKPHRPRHWHDRRDWRRPIFPPGRHAFRDERCEPWRPRPGFHRHRHDGRDRGRDPWHRDFARPEQPVHPEHPGWPRDRDRPRRDWSRPGEAPTPNHLQPRRDRPEHRDRNWADRRRERVIDLPGSRPGGGSRREPTTPPRDRQRFAPPAAHPLPSGPTPAITPPVAPAAPIVPPVMVARPSSPPRAQPAPQLSPNGRRLPDSGPRQEMKPRERSPNGRLLPDQSSSSRPFRQQPVALRPSGGESRPAFAERARAFDRSDRDAHPASRSRGPSGLGDRGQGPPERRSTE